MKILTKNPCADCKGAGLVQDQRWRDAYKAEGESGKVWDISDFEKWFAKMGISEEHLPKEESICDTCEGKGEIESWIPLEDLVAEILTMAKQSDL